MPGFFGTYILKQLLLDGADVTVFDLKENNIIFDQVLTPEVKASVKRVYGDISDSKVVTELVQQVKPTAIVHLAGLQIPTCRANPVLGASVNVIGTINVFEAAKALAAAGSPMPRVVYASSAAVFGPQSDYESFPVPDDYYHKPHTIYGVFKLCNEGCARIYAADHGINSVGLRPYTCFGVGREIGLTSGPTKAIKATVLGRKYELAFSGINGFSYIEDVARIFIGCTRAPVNGALAFNIRGEYTTVENFVEIMNQVLPKSKELITVTGTEIPILSNVDESGLTALLESVPEPHNLKKPFPLPLADCIKETAAAFEALHKEGRLHGNDLE